MLKGKMAPPVVFGFSCRIALDIIGLGIIFNALHLLHATALNRKVCALCNKHEISHGLIELLGECIIVICTPLCLSSSPPLIPIFYGGMRIHYLIVCYGMLHNCSPPLIPCFYKGMRIHYLIV